MHWDRKEAIEFEYLTTDRSTMSILAEKKYCQVRQTEVEVEIAVNVTKQVTPKSVHLPVSATVNLHLSRCHECDCCCALGSLACGSI